MKLKVTAAVALFCVLGASPLSGSADETDRAREKLGGAVGTAAGLGCAATAAAFGAASGPFGAFTGPLVGLMCYVIGNSATQTALNCTTPKGGRGKRGSDGSCVVISVGFGVGF